MSQSRLSDSQRQLHVYGMAPVIRFTLLGLYIALVLPLPVIATGVLRIVLWGAVALGLSILVAITSEQVILDTNGLQLKHPHWCRWWLRRGWQLHWHQVKGLKTVGTSQGGRVFYLQTTTNQEPEMKAVDRAYLLPQRVENFEDFLVRFHDLSGLTIDHVQRLTPLWTYKLLAFMTLCLFAGEVISLSLRP